jgi:hypothetical protein
MNRRKFGPSLDALSGVSTHVRTLFASDLARDYELLHFQVGSEGRRENALQKLVRLTRSSSARAVSAANRRPSRSYQRLVRTEGLLA